MLSDLWILPTLLCAAWIATRLEELVGLLEQKTVRSRHEIQEDSLAGCGHGCNTACILCVHFVRPRRFDCRLPLAAIIQNSPLPATEAWVLDVSFGRLRRKHSTG
jgi:hypothetical protein